MAPEVVQKHYTLSADLWSTGILAYLLLTGRLPFAKGQRQSSELYATKQVGGCGLDCLRMRLDTTRTRRS